MNPEDFRPVFAAWLLMVTALSSNSSSAAAEASKLARSLSQPPPNFTRVGEVVEGTLAQGRSIRISLPIETAGCYRIAAAAGEGSNDISLVVYQSGVEKARDRLSGKRPFVDWCTPEGGRVEAEVLMFAGEGAFAVSVFLKNPPKSTSPKDKKSGGDENDFIANRIRQLAPHFATEKRPISEVLRGSVLKNSEQSIPVYLRGKCVTIIAAQTPSLLEIDMKLIGSAGTVPTNLIATPSYTTLSPLTCPTPGDYYINVRAIRGNGSFGFQVFSE